MYRKLLIATILCTSVFGGREKTVEEPEETQKTEITESEAPEKNEDANEVDAPVIENTPEQTENEQPPVGITVDEDASYEFEEDTDYIIN